jgi:hypothetical protein
VVHKLSFRRRRRSPTFDCRRRTKFCGKTSSFSSLFGQLDQETWTIWAYMYISFSMFSKEHQVTWILSLRQSHWYS